MNENISENNINRTSGELLFLREDNNGTLEEKLL